ncbi:AAA family ATPase, partial [Candidatus Dojkabacteria bacterium]|nr:AAA family ATPase [Candidatus Dojkabacteria bacterium]
MIKNIKLKKFRNLNLQTDLDPNINIIIGKNGLGKSNFIDSVYYFSYGKSFKRISDSDSIAFDDTIGFARMEAVINNDEQTKLAVTFSRVDDKSYKKLEVNDLATIKRKFNNHLYAVMFSPETLDIIIGSPDLRREDLDDFISGINDEYEHKLRDYKN